MPGERNTEIVRPLYEAFNERDWDALFRGTVSDFAFTYHNVDASPARTRRGRNEVVAFSEEYGDVFDKLTWEPVEFIESSDQVVVLVDSCSRPPGGSVDLVVRNGHLWTVRDALALSLESFPDTDAALEAAGLR